MRPCPECGEEFDGLVACSAACIRLFRFGEIQAGRPDPFNGNHLLSR